MKTRTLLWLFVAGIVLIVLLRKPINIGMAKLTRGYRNKNPGNIRKTKSLWKGEVVGTDKDFKTFRTMGWGYRALFALLREYIHSGYNTIEKIISRYAPATENKTEAYILAVCKKTGLQRDNILSFLEMEKMKLLVCAISFVENGVAPNYVDIETGLDLLNA